MKEDVGSASLELPSKNICRVIAFCCAVGGMIGDVNYEKEIIHLI